MTFELSEIKPGATYLMRVDELTQREAQTIVQAWRSLTPESSRLLVLDSSVEIRELTDDELQELGLRRVSPTPPCPQRERW